MLASEQNIKLIFGLKIKQLRQGKKMSFKDLSHASGMSVSYLNEIEKGKKYPKTEKIVKLSEALDVAYDELVSLKLEKKWEPITDLLESGVLSALPLHMFGLDVSTLMEIISNAPVKINAFISTILKIARNYEMTQEHFYFAALRSYQEMHDNYFPELEEAVDNFIKEFDIDVTPPVKRSQLYDVLTQTYGYTIDRETLNSRKELQDFRSVVIKKDKKLLINDTLNNTQKSFLLGKELAFNYLKLTERPYTLNLFKANSFEEVLNNFKSSYFSVALFLNRHLLKEELDGLFKSDTWDGDRFLSLMRKYAASPEMFFNRLVNLLTHYYNLNNLFFLRFNNEPGKDRYNITKELHLTRLHQPHRNDLNEHYCRRWVSVRTLKEFAEGKSQDGYRLDVQISSYVGSGLEYFCISIARPDSPTPNSNISVTLGLLVNAQSKRKIRFLNDPNIPVKQVNETCERCPITDCQERVAAPKIVETERRQQAVEAVLAELEE